VLAEPQLVALHFAVLAVQHSNSMLRSAFQACVHEGVLGCRSALPGEGKTASSSASVVNLDWPCAAALQLYDCCCWWHWQCWQRCSPVGAQQSIAAGSPADVMAQSQACALLSLLHLRCLRRLGLLWALE